MIKKNWVKIVIVLILLAAIGFGGYYWNNLNSSNLRQAVFLTNGQVYFGYISNAGGQIVKLRNVYYIKTQDLLQQTSEQTDDKKKIALVKLGKELHGPTDEIFISRDQILFYENMRQDSKISQAIDKNDSL